MSEHWLHIVSRSIFTVSSLSLCPSVRPSIHPAWWHTVRAWGRASCYRVARTLRKEMMSTQKDWPTPNTSASSEIILFPAALYTPAIAAPVRHIHTHFIPHLCQIFHITILHLIALRHGLQFQKKKKIFLQHLCMHVVMHVWVLAEKSKQTSLCSNYTAKASIGFMAEGPASFAVNYTGQKKRMNISWA